MKKNTSDSISSDGLLDLASQCKRIEKLAHSGVIFLNQCNSIHGEHDLTVEELAEIGRNADFEKLMTSPQLLKWWNALR